MTLAPQLLDALVERTDTPGGLAFDDAKLAQATAAFDAARDRASRATSCRSS